MNLGRHLCCVGHFDQGTVSKPKQKLGVIKIRELLVELAFLPLMEVSEELQPELERVTRWRD
jgi:hypothetical protein